MKQSIGNIWITTLVITFMLIFVGYLTFMISYSDAEITKNDVISIIEKRNGITSMAPKCDYKSIFGLGNVCNDYGTLEAINMYLSGRMYHVKGYCPTDNETWYGVKTLDANKSKSDLYERAQSGKKYYYCFAKLDYQSSVTRKNKSAYYRVTVFYQLDLPIMPAMQISQEGKTGGIIMPSNCEIPEFNAGVGCPSGRMK